MSAFEEAIKKIFLSYADMNDEGDMMMPLKQHEYEGMIKEMAKYAKDQYYEGYEHAVRNWS